MYDEGIEVGWLVMAMATTAALVMLVYNSIFMYVCIGIGYGLLELWICEYWRIGHTQSREHTKEWYVLKEEVEEDRLSKYFHLPGVNQFPESSSLWLIITIHQFLQPSFLTTAMYVSEFKLLYNTGKGQLPHKMVKTCTIVEDCIHITYHCCCG